MLAYRLTYKPGTDSKGPGLVMVLLHAFPLSSAMWEKERKELSAYATILAPDLSGFGPSDKQKFPSIAGMAGEIHSLLEHLKIQEPVILGGLSMGGYVAFEFLRQFPECVRGLMLFSTRALADTAEVQKNRFDAIVEIQKHGLKSFTEKLQKKLLGKTTFEFKPEIEHSVLNMIMKNKVEGITDALSAMAQRKDASDLLAGILCPCLVVAGEEDEIISPVEMREMSDQIPGSEYHEIPKAGHLVNLEQPEVFRALIASFLATEILSRYKSKPEDKRFRRFSESLKMKGGKAVSG